MKYQQPDDIQEVPYITIGLDKKEAAALLASDILNSQTKKWLKNELRPTFLYQLKCDCGRVFVHYRKTKLTPEEVEKGGICSQCEDDWK